MFGINMWIGSFLITSAFISILMAVYAINKKDVPATLSFSLLCVSTAMYSFGYAMELMNNDIKIMLSWNFFQHIAVELIPLFWLIISIEYCGKEKILTNKNKLIFFLIPLFFIVFRYTTQMNHLFYQSMVVESNGYFPVIHLEFGPLFYINAIYVTLCVLFANVLYLKAFYRSKGAIRYQALLLFIASLFPYFSFCLILTDSLPLDIDFTCIALFVSHVFFLIALFKYQFFDLIPLAYDKVFKSIKEAVLVLDINYNILDFNISAANIFTKLNKESIGKSLSLFSGEYADFTQSVFRGKETQVEIKRDNASNFYLIKLSMLYNKRISVIGYIVILNDITEQYENMKRLEQIASIDGLTGIYNRRCFLERCESEFRKAVKEKYPLSLIIFDIDEFKTINDRFGHLAGDMVLKKIVEVCKENIRSNDIFGRFGGEEFIILLQQATIEEAAAIGENVRRSIEMCVIMFESNKIGVTSSFGVTGISGGSIQNEMDLDILIKFADQALYVAKADGKNCIKVLAVHEQR